MSAACAEGELATVLVVDDEAIIRHSTAEYLRDRGWRVLEASSGEEARLLFERESSIGLVFSDVEMGRGASGITLARWLREHHPEVHVLLTSGAASMKDAPRNVSGIVSTFPKPYQCDAVATRIGDLVGLGATPLRVRAAARY